MEAGAPLPWTDRSGVRVIEFETADEDVAVLLEETWSKHILLDHPYMSRHFDKIQPTLAQADGIYESKALGRSVVIYMKNFQGPSIRGRTGENPTFLVVVNRGPRSIATVYAVDFVESRVGRKIWPKS